VTGKSTPFSFVVPTVPRRVVLDPDAEVFRLLAPAELPPTVNMLKATEKLLIVTTKSCRAREETLQLLLESLGQRARIVTEESLDASAIRHNDLLFCGAPQHHEVFPSLPEGTVVSNNSFMIDGAPYKDSHDLLFLALRHPFEGRVVALFFPLSKEAAEEYVLKITHYGKYGYLVFSGGKNVRKGMSALSTGGGAVEFTGEPQ